MRWLWWAPFGVFVLFWAVIGFRYGWKAMHTTETEVINRYAALYVAERGAGAALTDCAATPSEDRGVWLVVRCAPALAADRYEFHVNRVGELTRLLRPTPPAAHEPQA